MWATLVLEHTDEHVDAHADVIDWPDLFARARGRVGMKHETLAGYLGIGPAQLSQQLSGQGHVSLFRVVALSRHREADAREIGAVLFDGIAQAAGYGEFDPLAVSMGRLLVVLGDVLGHVQLRMVKAELSSTVHERRHA